MANKTLDQTPVKSSVADSAIVAIAEGDKMKNISVGNLLAPVKQLITNAEDHIADVESQLGAKISVSEKGVPGGVASLGDDGLVPITQLSITGLTFMGDWKPSVNVPSLSYNEGEPGQYYQVAEPGSHDFGDGDVDFQFGDRVIYGNDGKWVKYLSADLDGPGARVGLRQSGTGAQFRNNATVSGGSSFTVVGNKCRITGGVDSFSDYMMLNTFKSMSENITFAGKYQIISNAFIGFSFRCPGFLSQTITFGHFEGPTYPHDVNAYFANSFTTYSKKSTGVLATSANDIIAFKITRNGNTFIAQFTNETTEQSISMSFTYNLSTDISVPIMPNRYQFAIHSFEGTADLLEYSITSNDLVAPDILWVGNSIMAGYEVGSIDARFADKASKILGLSYAVHAGAGLGTVEMLEAKDEMLAMKPKRVILSGGGNDAPSTDTIGNYGLLKEAFELNGAVVTFLTEPLRNSTDLTTMNSNIYETFSSSNLVINISNSTRNGSTTGNAAQYYSPGAGGYLHPNPLGAITYVGDIVPVLAQELETTIDVGLLQLSAPVNIGGFKMIELSPTHHLLGANITFDGSFKYVSDGPGSVIQCYEDEINLFNFASGVAGNNATAQLAMKLKSGRVVSIGAQAEYADNVAAVSAGLSAGSIYRTGDILKVVH